MATLLGENRWPQPDTLHLRLLWVVLVVVVDSAALLVWNVWLWPCWAQSPDQLWFFRSWDRQAQGESEEEVCRILPSPLSHRLRSWPFIVHREGDAENKSKACGHTVQTAATLCGLPSGVLFGARNTPGKWAILLQAVKPSESR